MSDKKKYQGDRVKVRTRRYKKRRVYRNQYSSIISPTSTASISSTTSTTTTTTPITPDSQIITAIKPTSSNIINNQPSCTPQQSELLNETASSSKVQLFPTDTPKQTQPITGYRIIDIELLSFVFSLLHCPKCSGNTVELHGKFSKKKGFASYLCIECKSCDYSYKFYTSRIADKTFDINRRMIYSMRTIGQGYSALEQFTAIMNMPRQVVATTSLALGLRKKSSNM